MVRYHYRSIDFTNQSSNSMGNIISWLITSSADPSEVSSTLKGLLLFAAPFIVGHAGIDADLANSLVGSIVLVVNDLFALIGAMVALFGFVRKIKLGRWAHPAA